MRRRLFFLFWCLVLVLSLPAEAGAVELPDLTRKDGTIQICLRYDGSFVTGGTVRCVRLGKLMENQGDYFFQRYHDETRMEDLDSPGAAEEQEAFYQSKKLYYPFETSSCKVGTDGIANFRGLKSGVYLIRQTENSKGDYAFAPFLVTIPYQKEGEYTYQVEASAKLEVRKADPTEPEETTAPSGSGSGSGKPGGKLPQTGQGNWPVPALAAGGLMLLLLGGAVGKGKRKRICAVLGAGMIAGAWCFFMGNRAEDRQAEEASRMVMAVIEQKPEMALPEAEPEERDEETLVSEVAVPVPGNSEMTEVEIGGNRYIGYLEIPAMGRRLPVMSGWSESKLRVAPCRYFGSTGTEDLVIMAHNYGCHFGGIGGLPEGERVEFTDMEGNREAYRVALVETLPPTDMDYMTAGTYPLTLFTCTYGGESRVTVRCEKLQEQERNHDR